MGGLLSKRKKTELETECLTEDLKEKIEIPEKFKIESDFYPKFFSDRNVWIDKIIHERKKDLEKICRNRFGFKTSK